MEDHVVDMIRDDIKELKSDVKLILRFKYQVIGGAVATSIIVTGAFQLVLLIASLKN